MDARAWDERYAESELVWTRGPNQFLEGLVGADRPGTAVDLACGEGRNAIWLANQGWSVTGIDFSPGGIAKAQELAGDLNIEWVVGDVTRPLSGVYDLVLMFYLHLPPDEMGQALDAALGAVAPGGRLVAVGHAVRNVTDGAGGPQAPEILWSESTFETLDGFQVIERGERLRPVKGSDVAAIDIVVNAVRS